MQMTKKNTDEKNIWKTMHRLLSYSKGSSWLLGITIILTIAGTIMQVLSPKILGKATTLLFATVTKQQAIEFQKLQQILLIVGLLYLGKFITDFFQETLMTVVAQKITQKLRNDLKQKTNQLSSSYFDQHTNGNLMSIAINDIDNIATMLQQNLVELVSSSILAIGIIGIMLTISWQLTLVASIIIPLSTLVTKIFTPKTQSNFRAYLKTQGTLNGKIEETFTGQEVIKSFSNEKQALNAFDHMNHTMYESGWKSKFYGGSMMPAMLFLKNIIYVVVIILGALQVTASKLTIGNLQAFLQYSTQFSRPISQFSQIWNGFLSTIASAERVFAVLDAKEVTVFSDANFPTNVAENAEICFDHVQFGYSPGKLLMKDFSLHVNEGELVAIVGQTGAGKTTLVNLLQRFYEISGGSIRIRGNDIRNFSHQELHKKIGMVLQETWLFSGSIYDNIQYGNPAASMQEVVNAAKMAYVDDFVTKLPDGYMTILNEETSNISQGQKQLITIARAFLANPEILILDEATSNVDTRTERLIQQAMKNLLVGRTSFVIAHRLSTIYDAHKIVVMQQGDVVETGSHNELLTQKGVYNELYQSQYDSAL